MSKDKLLPKLRFKKFVETGAWQKYLLEELVEVNNGKDYKHLGKGEIPVYGTGGYMTKVNAALSYEKDAIGIGRKGTIDKPYILKAPYWTVDTLFYAIPKFDSNINFFQGIFKNINWLSKQESTGVPSLSKSTINNIEILIPTIQEQQQIGTFLKKNDEMIQLQQSKVNKAKNLKSAYLSEMFPKEGEKYPERRFEGFTEPWMTKKLGSLLDYEQPTNYIVKSDSYDDSYLTPVLTAGKSFLLGYTNETEGIYKADNNNGVIIFDDFTTSSHFVDFDFKVKSSAMKFLRTNQSNFNLYFLYNLLTSINYSPESHERHWISIFSEFEVLVPTKKEQQKIAQLFKNLDNQISIEEEKLTKLEKLKQAYLNDMFV